MRLRVIMTNNATLSMKRYQIGLQLRNQFLAIFFTILVGVVSNMGQHQYLILWLWMLHMFQLKNCFVLQVTRVRGSDPKEEDWKDQIANRPHTLKIVFFFYK